ncbi:hypothetical protein LMG28614_05189 [Paraburkholderia ultramafica]|uniref:Transposase n=1 Tax=Paraburkholderia ultramafica TaxID=1544867 RepID=A0A6S7BHD5_9BURK|nr:hypothetical protein LMG28614_05189 [Paraburkholderia ultramafica]
MSVSVSTRVSLLREVGDETQTVPGGADRGRAQITVPPACQWRICSVSWGSPSRSFYQWKKQYAGLESNQLRELKQLQDENARLKKLVAELGLDKAILQDIAVRKWPRPR